LYLVGRQDALAESILAVTLLQRTASFDCQADDKLEGVGTEYRIILLRFSPDTVFMVP